MAADAARMESIGRATEAAGALPRKQVEVAIAIVFDGGGPESGEKKLLICRRKANVVLGGFWEFPGGKCEPGEAAEVCACREVREETGLDVRIVRPLPTIEHEYPHAHVRLHPFLCQRTGGTLQPLEVAEALWIEPSAVGQYAFPEANAGLVVRIARGYKALLSE